MAPARGRVLRSGLERRRRRHRAAAARELERGCCSRERTCDENQATTARRPAPALTALNLSHCPRVRDAAVGASLGSARRSHRPAAGCSRVTDAALVAPGGASDDGTRRRVAATRGAGLAAARVARRRQRDSERTDRRRRRRRERMSMDDAASDDSELESSGREGDNGGGPLTEGGGAQAIPAASDSSGWATRVVDVGQPRRATSRPLPPASLISAAASTSTPATGLLPAPCPPPRPQHRRHQDRKRRTRRAERRASALLLVPAATRRVDHARRAPSRLCYGSGSAPSGVAIGNFASG